MSAKQLYHHKVTLLHRDSEIVAIAELKVWKVKEDKNFPEGIKYSLFLVNPSTSEVIFGMDNHKPKGHHQHINGEEIIYNFQGTDKLVDDFWEQVEKEGFIL